MRKRRRSQNYVPPQEPHQFQAPRRYRNYRPTGETKYFDTETDDFTVGGVTGWGASADAVKGIIAIPQEGSDIDNRIGRKISIHKIAVRGIVKFTPSMDQNDVLDSPAIRLIFWQDKQTNGTVTTSAALMKDPTNAEADNVFCSFQNPANFGRFRVWKDICFDGVPITAVNDAAATSSQNRPHMPFKFTVKFKKPIDVKFNATNGGTIADIVDNAFYISIMASTSNMTKDVTIITRTYYKDI